MSTAHEARDIGALTDAVEKAVSSELGPGHSCVLQGKRWLEALRKQRTRSKHAQSSKHAEEVLAFELIKSDDALSRLKSEVGFGGQIISNSPGLSRSRRHVNEKDARSKSAHKSRANKSAPKRRPSMGPTKSRGSTPKRSRNAASTPQGRNSVGGRATVRPMR